MSPWTWNRPERRRRRPMRNRQQFGLAKELRFGGGRRACREETEAVAPETSAAPQPGSRRTRKTAVGNDGDITRAEGVSSPHEDIEFGRSPTFLKRYIWSKKM